MRIFITYTLTILLFGTRYCQTNAHDEDPTTKEIDITDECTDLAEENDKSGNFCGNFKRCCSDFEIAQNDRNGFNRVYQCQTMEYHCLEDNSIPFRRIDAQCIKNHCCPTDGLAGSYPREKPRPTTPTTETTPTTVATPTTVTTPPTTTPPRGLWVSIKFDEDLHSILMDKLSLSGTQVNR